MPFCFACGYRVGEEMRFCPSCGAALSAAAALAVTPAQDLTDYTAPQENLYAQEAYDAGLPENDYRLVLVSCGSCTKITARSLLQDTLGYSLAEARQLTDAPPIELACALTFQQALDLARMFTEYGMQVTVYNSGGYVDLGLYARSSVFNSSGTILESVAATLATLSAINRVRQFLRWSKPEPLRHIFAPRYMPSRPPRYVPRPAPKPLPRRDPAPPHPVRLNQPRPAPSHHSPDRPTGPARPAGGRPGGSAPGGHGGKPGGGRGPGGGR